MSILCLCMQDLTNCSATVGICTMISGKPNCLHILVVVCEEVSLRESGEGQSEKPTSHRHRYNNQCVPFSDIVLDQIPYGFD